MSVQQKKKSRAQLIASLPEKKRNKFFDKLTEEEARALEYDWEFWWSRPKQRIPEGDWSNWLILAGRGWGKTRTGAETVRKWIKDGVRRIALVAETPADARDIMIEGESGLLNIFPPEKQPKYIASKRKIIFHNGAEAHIYSGANPDQLRGPQHEKAWADELASWDYAQETWDNLMFGLRLGENPQTIVTTTPRPIPVIRELAKDENTHVTKGSTYANRANLPSSFYKKVIGKYEGTRLGRQEIHAEVLSDSPGALWSYDLFKYVDRNDMPNLKRIVVAIDPAMSNTDSSDETGIIVAGLGVDNRGYILHDGSGIYSPATWASRAIALYKKFSADKIVGEVNQGGDMVESTLRSVNKNVSYKKVHASRGKALRAEPVASLYEQEKVYHKKQFSKLEDQLCTWQPGEDSPDRLDALVWAMTELMLNEAGPRIRSL
ncbi:MAG: terminase family protein [Halanaerobiales bacterium]|nr:terminase family protein [Halanaerobiales bacterium]